jgi:hypothetical protein
MIQEAYAAFLKKRKASERNIEFGQMIRRNKMSPSELVILEPSFSP